MNKNRQFWKGLFIGMFSVILAAMLVLGVDTTVDLVQKVTNTDKAGRAEQKREKIDAIIDSYYLYEDEIDEDALFEGTYAGYVEALGDPYSVYYSAEEAKELLDSTAGEYSGIGAVMTQDVTTKQIMITNVYEDSPAQKAGLQAGDILVQVDEKKIMDESLSEVVTWIKGEEGTNVQIHVVREEEELTLTATRTAIEIQTVAYEMKENQIGYLAVSEFDTVTYGQFEHALEELERQGMEGLIVDLRSNPGGNLDTVVDMLDLILPEGNIVTIKDKNGKEEEYNCDGEHEFTKPLVVLTNEYSASASEIFAGAVKDYGIGTLVGTTTYGKGIVQQLIDLGDGSYLRMTIAEYFTPSGENIHGKGISPDVEVEYVPDENDVYADNQLDKAMEVMNEMLK